MGKMYHRSVLRDIKKSFGRFIAIIAIVALGVGFLVGVLSATPDMKVSVDRYYDENRMCDIFMKSAAGFTEADIAAVSDLDKIDQVMPAYVTDTLMSVDGGEVQVARIFGVPLTQNDEPEFVNRLTLLEGRMPEQAAECVIQRPMGYLSDISVGAKLYISEENADAASIGGTYRITEYTVVGIVGNPFYFSSEKETSAIGNGRVGMIVYADSSCYALPVYTDLYVMVKGAAQMTAFTDTYESYIAEAVSAIEKIAETQTAHGSQASAETTGGNPAAGGQNAEASPGSKWYVLDRTSNVSYASYRINVQKVADVAKLFPIFFFLVAALVTLTTMTRMVEEDRTEIGTLKAIGYSKGAITYKYVAYSGLATAIGCLFGLATGFQLMPAVFYNAYETLYMLPPLVTQLDWIFALISCTLEIVCTIGATLLSCGRSLREKPAYLMLPRVPKAGQRILLERIPFIWKHLSFSYKASARNIIRNKRHLFMTVIGVAGCTALLLTGFGLRDSTEVIANRQFQEILLYDMKIDYPAGIEAENGRDPLAEDTELLAFLKDKPYTVACFESVGVTAAGKHVDAALYVPRDAADFTQFIRLHDRKEDTDIALNSDSVILTEKMAETLDVGIGESVTLENAANQKVRLVVTGITENYVGCCVYIHESVYLKAFGSVSYNTVFVKSGITDQAEQDAAVRALTKTGAVSAVEFNTQMRKTYEDLLSSMTFIVLVLILAAGALAAIVLYNLTNVNINERTKELATLRVLGYHHGEVARYIFREIVMLTILGTLTGLLLGTVLHRYVIITAESVDLMFGRTISPWSFVFAAVLTLTFSAAVDLLMLIKLKRIRMVESMKAVD